MAPTSTSIHEAGHAIVAMALGLQVGTVTIVPDEDNNRAGSSCNEPGESPVDEATVYYAGWEAERLFDPADAELSRWASSSDDGAAAELLKGADAGDLESRCRESARRLLVEHWATVVAVALDLDHWLSLDPDAVALDFEGGDHNDLAVELAEYRARNPRIDLALDQLAAERERLLKVLEAASSTPLPGASSL